MEHATIGDTELQRCQPRVARAACTRGGLFDSRRRKVDRVYAAGLPARSRELLAHFAVAAAHHKYVGVRARVLRKRTSSHVVTSRGRGVLVMQQRLGRRAPLDRALLVPGLAVHCVPVACFRIGWPGQGAESAHHAVHHCFFVSAGAQGGRRKATERMTGMAKGIALLALAAIAIVAAAIPAWFGVARHEELEQAASPKTGGGSGELERHVARLEAESARIEAVRQRAESLNDKIADLERRGKSTTSAEGTAALAVEADELKARLSALARDAHFKPSPTSSERAVGGQKDEATDTRLWPSMAVHRYIDEESRSQKPLSAAGSKSVGVLGRTREIKHPQGPRVDASVPDTSWETAPKLDRWGQEQLGVPGPKEASIDFYNYGNPTRKRNWEYGPHESLFGSDLVPGTESPSKQKGASFSSSLENVQADDSWKVAPKGDSVLDHVVSNKQVSSEDASVEPRTAAPRVGTNSKAQDRPVGEDKAWVEAEAWFKRMRRSTTEHLDAERWLAQRARKQRFRRKKMEARMQHFKKIKDAQQARTAQDIHLLRRARAAEEALDKLTSAPSTTTVRAASKADHASSRTKSSQSPARRVEGSSATLLKHTAVADVGAAASSATDGHERNDALQRTENHLKALMQSADSKFGQQVANFGPETAAHQEQTGWQKAAEKAAERSPWRAAVSEAAPHPLAQATALGQTREATSKPNAVLTDTQEDSSGEIDSMEAELRKARVEVRSLPASQRSAGDAAIAAMQRALQGAEASTAVIGRSGRGVSALRSHRLGTLESDPTVLRAEKAQEKVWRLQQALLAAKTGTPHVGWADAAHQADRAVLRQARRVLGSRGASKTRGSEKGGGSHSSKLWKLGINTGDGTWDDLSAPLKVH